MATKAFQDRIWNELLPTFCDDPSRGWGREGFKKDWHKVSERDAEDFLRALDSGLLTHVGRGLYRAPRSYASEQFFWSGSKESSPRTITIWVEPVITVAVLARLHFDLGWPRDRIGTQSKKWEFDVTAFVAPDHVNEHIACEVKKTRAELDVMLEQMSEYGSRFVNPSDVPRNALNSFRKLEGLRARRAPLFWAAGPDGFSAVFRVIYSGNIVMFEEAPFEALRYTVISTSP